MVKLINSKDHYPLTRILKMSLAINQLQSKAMELELKRISVRKVTRVVQMIIFNGVCGKMTYLFLDRRCTLIGIVRFFMAGKM